ncbi:MAG: acetylxylan esterase, partial [Planctomycetota bacterium]|nr:acetylxylan esterase [Planctomycetota bacterium]
MQVMQLSHTWIPARSNLNLRISLTLLIWFWTSLSISQDSLTQQDRTPSTVDELWAEYDPRAEPLETHIVRQWENEDTLFRYVTFLTGQFHGTKARLAAFYAFPKNQSAKRIPGLIHYHGGGQRASLREVTRFSQRGYAVLSINWGGREMERALPNEENTDWGKVDPTQKNVVGYSSLLPAKNRIDPFPSARNNNWFLLAIAGRRAITFMQQQPEVDPERIGIYGHSMGGRLTGLVAGIDHRVKVASPSVGGSGFLQTDYWGLPNTARRVRGDLKVFQSTIA